MFVNLFTYQAAVKIVALRPVMGPAVQSSFQYSNHRGSDIRLLGLSLPLEWRGFAIKRWLPNDPMFGYRQGGRKL